MGIMRSGGAYVPLDPNWPVSRINHILMVAHAQAIVVQHHLRAKLPSAVEKPKQDKIRVLLFGDSNIWGLLPGGQRLSAGERVPVILAQALGRQCEVVADAISGRGFSTASNNVSLQTSLRSQEFDVCVIMLGTNDAASEASLSFIEESAYQLLSLVKHASVSQNTRIIIVAPPPIQDGFSVPQEWNYHSHAVERAIALNQVLKTVAERMECGFLDAGLLLASCDDAFSSDGVHLSAVGSRALATSMTAAVRSVSKEGSNNAFGMCHVVVAEETMRDNRKGRDIVCGDAKVLSSTNETKPERTRLNRSERD